MMCEFTLVTLLVVVAAACLGLVGWVHPTRNGTDYSQEEIHLILLPGAVNIIAKWDTTFSRVTVTWEDDCGGTGLQILDDATEAVVTNLRPCTDVAVSLYPDGLHNPAAATATTHTLAQAPPEVRNLTTSSVSTREIFIAWEKPDTECPITVYIINYSGVARNNPSTKHTGSETIDGGDATNHTITGLQPNTNYDVEVVAVTERGKGKPAHITASTEEEVPSRPRELKSISQSSNSISLTWNKPEEANGVLGNYRVSWYEDGRDVGEAFVPYPTHTIMDLSPCVEYMVRVAATTGAGEGAYEEVTQTTMTGLPSIYIDFCTIAPDTQEVTVVWSKPETACLITSYELSWQNDADNQIASINAFTAGLTHDYTAALPPGDETTVCVAAMLETERGQRTCCVETIHPKLFGSGWIWTTNILVVSVFFVATALGLTALVQRLGRSNSKRLEICSPGTSPETKRCLKIGN